VLAEVNLQVVPTLVSVLLGPQELLHFTEFDKHISRM
jgi:hypothetical protein